MTWSRKTLSLAAPLLVAAPFLMGMRACGDDVPLGGEDCSAEGACGTALGAPAITCWDGSIGGNTGVCQVGADGACHWQYRDCPPPPDDCTDAECGPAPATPLPTRCERGADAICRWVVDDPGACSADECGPTPGTPTWTCDDGTIGGFTGRCERGPDDACAWVIVDCPMGGECTVEECGPQPDSAACTCADGSLGCNTGRCLRDASGACGWEWRECPTAVSCGGLTPTPVDCGEGYLCAHSVEDICGAADAPGTCQRRPSPDECAAIDSAPVCGCDGVTYDNECFAWAAGTSASSYGACAGHDCDTRQVLCDVIPPSCPAGQVPTQSGACYGPCVPVGSCAAVACAADADCPDPAVWSCVSGTCAAR